MSGEEEEEREKSVLTIASYACNYHHGWRMQVDWTNMSIYNYNLGVGLLLYPEILFNFISCSDRHYNDL